MPAILKTKKYTVRRLALLVSACLLFLVWFNGPSGFASSSPSLLRPTDVTTPSEDQSIKAQESEVGAVNDSNAAAQEDPPRSRLSLEFQKILDWHPPDIQDHYPPYNDYEFKDFDPNRWEEFELHQNFYTNGSIAQIPNHPTEPSPWYPYPSNTPQYIPCDGADGTALNRDTDKSVHAYHGVPEGFPEPDCGSFEAIGLDGSVCWDRFARLGPYGYDTNFDYSQTRWMDLQNKCTDRNKERFRNSSPPPIGPDASSRARAASAAQSNVDSTSPTSSRSAVLIRTWGEYDYQENDFQAIRSLITELSLMSGGEYHVFLFVQIKDMEAKVFTNQAVYNDLLEKHVPEEFRDITVLWTESICQAWYPEVGEWSVYFQQWMPLQWFSQTHPEFDYVWNWEMDARYIGNHYHFLEQVSKFSREQPRKHLWERNSRFYFPAVHGSYENFTEETNRIASESPFVESVWGPQRWSDRQEVFGPTPPTTEVDDHYTWGVGEEADFITLLPMWDPRQTLWSYRDKLWGYPNSTASTEEHQYLHVPRRVFINTLSRLSKTLLAAMHQENLAGYSMASEMMPSSTALQHGLKAVYTPHPIWFSHKWPTEYLDPVFNADGWGAGSHPEHNDVKDGRGRGYDLELERQGRPQVGTGPNHEGVPGRWSQERDAVYSPDREHNLGGWSWYFWSDFPKVLYWRWLGWKAAFSIVTIEGTFSTDELRDQNWAAWEAENGRLCYPGMLLHPVKNVKEALATPENNEEKPT